MPLPSIPAELLEWQVFYVELLKQLGLEPDSTTSLCSMENTSGTAKSRAWRKLSNVKASLRRKEIVLRNLDSLLERDGFNLAAYSQKRNGFLLEIKALRSETEGYAERP